MIHRVVSRRYRAGWAVLPILFGLFLSAMAPLPGGRQWSERYVAVWIAKERWKGLTADEGALVVATQARAVAAYHPGPIGNVRHVAPRQQLPRSAFGDARWSPLTDQIIGPTGRPWEPFEKPSLWYFTGVLHSVSGGTQASLQSAFAAAVDGDIIEVASHVALTSAYDIPNRGTPGYVLVRGAGFGVAQGTRVTSADFTGAYALTQTTATNCLRMAQGASGWYFRGLQIRNGYTSTTVGAEGPLMWAATTMTSTAHVPSNLIAEQCWVTGDWATNRMCKRALYNSADYTRVEQCRFDGFAGNGIETQAILFAQGRGHALVDDCYLEGASENIMAGAIPCTLGTIDYNADVLVRRCHIEKRVAWLGTAYTVRKNFYEIKNGKRHVVEGCEFENHDGAGQPYDFTLNAKPQNAADQALVANEDLWFRHNRLRGGMGYPGAGAGASAGGYYHNPGTARVQWSNNLWQNSRGQSKDAKWLITGMNTTPARTCPDIAAEFNTIDVYSTVLAFGGRTDTAAGTCPGLVFRNNVHYANVQYATPRSDNGGGDSALDAICGVGLWQMAGNVAYSTYQGFSWLGTTATNNYKAGSPILFADQANGDFTLVDSRYTNKATDGGAPGVNMPQLLTFTAGVR